MPSTPNAHGWQFFSFGLIVTGKGEEAFLPEFFRSLAATGHCTFKVIHKIGQRSPITSEKKKLYMVGSGKMIPDRDAEEIGVPARQHLAGDNTYVVLVDDLEADRSPLIDSIYGRYRAALNVMLGDYRKRASVHFFVNMMEAYYFADAQAINVVLGTCRQDFAGDVETIRHPKNDLKALKSGYDEVEDGREIVSRLDIPHVLSRPETCASLRTLFGWCSKAIGDAPGNRYQLLAGVYDPVTKPQIDDLDSPGSTATSG